MSRIPAVLATLCVAWFFVPESLADEPIDIGSRRELFVDQYLIEDLNGVRLELHRPEAREVVLVTDKPWEGNTSAYYTIFQDENGVQDDTKYRMYYRGSHWDEKAKKGTHPEVVCYAESRRRNPLGQAGTWPFRFRWLESQQHCMEWNWRT